MIGFTKQSIREFNRKAKNFTKKLAPSKFKRFYKSIVIQLWTGFIMNTPVGNSDLWKTKPKDRYVGGRARGNWQMTINHRADGIIDTVDPDGGKTLTEGLKVLNVLPKNGMGITIWITNNLPYIVALENGHSTQKPVGWIGMTIQRVGAML